MADRVPEGRDITSKEVGDFLERAFGLSGKDGERKLWDVDGVAARVNEKGVVVISGLKMQWGTDPEEVAMDIHQSRSIVELFNGRNRDGYRIFLEPGSKDLTAYVPLAEFENPRKVEGNPDAEVEAVVDDTHEGAEQV